MLTSPGHPQPDCTPDVDPHKAHRPKRDTGHAYRATRDKHTRRTHNVFKLAHRALISLRHGLMVPKPRGLWCLHARCFVKGGVIPHGHLGTRHEHADTQANAELTGSLHRDRPCISSRRLHGLTQLMGHPSDDRHALLARACPGVASMAHAMPWGKCPHTHGRRPCVGSCPRRCPRRAPASVRTELG